ncbi:hypothetical protein BJ546DRAFT_546135 [Cryomyces antarcticus]
MNSLPLLQMLYCVALLGRQYALLIGRSGRQPKQGEIIELNQCISPCSRSAAAVSDCHSLRRFSWPLRKDFYTSSWKRPQTSTVLFASLCLFPSDTRVSFHEAWSLHSHAILHCQVSFTPSLSPYTSIPTILTSDSQLWFQTYSSALAVWPSHERSY